MLIDNKDIILWCKNNIFSEGKPDDKREQEKDWGLKVIRDNEISSAGIQWTNGLCEKVVKEVLEKKGVKLFDSVAGIKSSIDKKIKYRPDFECSKYYYEVKGRSWNTPGTAGEKILGTPVKYSEIKRLKNKPVKIILVAYAEEELRRKFGCGNFFDPKKQTTELKGYLKWAKSVGVEYIPFTSLLKSIGL